MPYDTIITPYGYWLDKTAYHEYPILDNSLYPNWLRNYFYTHNNVGGMMMMENNDQYLPYQYDNDIGNRYIALNNYMDFDPDNIIKQLSMYHFLDENEAELSFPLSEQQRKMRSSFNNEPFNSTLNGYKKFLLSSLNGNTDMYNSTDEMKELLLIIKEPNVYEYNHYNERPY